MVHLRNLASIPYSLLTMVQMLTWRSTNKIDTIMDETNADFERFDGEFPGEMQGCDLGKLRQGYEKA